MKSLLMFLLGAVAGAVLGAVFIARYHTVTPTEAAAPVSIIPRPTPEEALAPQSPATLPAEPAPAQ